MASASACPVLNRWGALGTGYPEWLQETKPHPVPDQSLPLTSFSIVLPSPLLHGHPAPHLLPRHLPLDTHEEWGLGIQHHFAETAKSAEQACLGKNEVSSLQHELKSQSDSWGCTMWNARSQTPLIPLCLLTSVDKRGAGQVGAGAWEDPQGRRTPSLMNVTDHMIWLGLSSFYLQGVNLDLLKTNYRSRTVCVTPPMFKISSSVTS